jgi:hypothetical protein
MSLLDNFHNRLAALLLSRESVDVNICELFGSIWDPTRIIIFFRFENKQLYSVLLIGNQLHEKISLGLDYTK